MANNSAVSEATERLKRVLNVDESKNPDHAGWFLRFPGFKYGDFNRAGGLDVVKFDRMAQTLRGPDLRASSHVLLFTLGIHWTFRSQLYEKAAINCALTMRRTISRIGSTSYDSKQTFIDDVTSCQLAMCIHRVVCVDPLTRKSKPIPTERVDALLTSGFITNDDQFPVYEVPPAIPERTFTWSVRVLHDDMDFLFHTNTSSYLSFALECAARAVESGFYSVFNKDIAFYRAENLTCIYLAESRAGDELQVVTWQHPLDWSQLNFVIKKREKIITCLRIEYFKGVKCVL